MRGHDCRACHLLLITMAAVFYLKIVHHMEEIDESHIYSTSGPRRIVYIYSSQSDMIHSHNIDNGLESEMTTSDEDEQRVVKVDASCDICGMMFPSEKNMLRHREKHRHEK